jgi:hypothetical protein
MKKSIVASALVLAGVGLLPGSAMPAQEQSITVSNPLEYQAYTNANTQVDAAARATALEDFLKSYPQSVLKQTVLAALVDLYQNPFNADRELSADNRLLEVDPGNLKALYFAVTIEKAQGSGSKAVPPDVRVLCDAAEKARVGLEAAKPKGTSDSDWKNQTDAAYPMFHSAIAVDAAVNNDFKMAAEEYTAALKLCNGDAAKAGVCLSDTLQLADSYANAAPKDDQNQLNAIWFYARAWDFAPTSPENFKAEIQPHLEYWYNRYHGGLDGLDGVKKLAAATVFPQVDYKISRAPTLAEKIKKAIDENGVDGLSLQDKESILGSALKEDADLVWAKLKDQTTPVPGTVIAAEASAIKVTVTEVGKTPKLTRSLDYLVNLKTPIACEDAKAGLAGLKQQEDFILNSGFKDDTDELAKLFRENPGRIKKIVLDPTVSTIKVAVTPDAKNAKAADFIVNLKTPVACRALPAAGAEFGMQPAIELDGTYDTYTQVASTDATEQPVQIVLRDGFVQPEKKKPVARRPGTGPIKNTHT